MKLSEAIRLGSMLYPQGKRYYFNHGKTCAIGAALMAIGIHLEEGGKEMESDAIRQWRETPEAKEWVQLSKVGITQCPCCDYFNDTNFSGLIIHLNNEHWTREQVADWVELAEHRLEVLCA